MEKFISLPAIEVQQSKNRKIYSFVVDGKQVSSFATVSRIKRDGAILSGYQRPEMLNHITEIKKYLESESPMIPNAIVIAFNSKVKFTPSKNNELSNSISRVGTLSIPINDSDDYNDKPGFIVDGQQRLAAIREASINSFPICVSAFLTDDVKIQTEQFILVNSTKPLPKGLIYELLPSTNVTLPTLLSKKKFPSHLLECMNTDPKSPLYNMIQTPTNPKGIIKDNSILKMLENSLSDGVLYRYQTFTGDGNQNAMLTVLHNYWTAVKKVFSEAWGLPPKSSRLTHGAGIVALGFIMDAISDRFRDENYIPSIEDFEKNLNTIADVCRWTEGFWDFGPGCQRKWNEVQNTPKDIQMLSNFLVVNYKAKVWKKQTSSNTYIQ